MFVSNSRGPETLTDLAKETGATPVTVKEAARAGQVVIISIPLKSEPQLPKDLFASAASSTVVVDTGNYYPQRDGRIEEIENGMTETRWVSKQLNWPVVKAFNNIYAQHLLELGKPKGTPERIALPVAGDDKAAKDVVTRLIDELGFDAVDAGGLDDSWKQQPGTPVYGSDFDKEGVERALSQASKERKPEFRASAGTAPAPQPRRRAGDSDDASRTASP